MRTLVWTPKCPLVVAILGLCCSATPAAGQSVLGPVLDARAMEFLKPSLLGYPDAPSPADLPATADSVKSLDLTFSFPMQRPVNDDFALETVCDPTAPNPLRFFWKSIRGSSY